MADIFRRRQSSIQLFFIITAGILIFRASQLQLIDKSFRSRADAATMDEYTQYPSRGLIYDRESRLLVYNNPMYDLMVSYNQVDWNMDTSKFFKLLGIDSAYFHKALNKDWRDRRYSKKVPFVFLSKISAKTYAAFQESMYEFPGFYVQLRNIRGYPHDIAAHLLGYIREVNQEEVSDSTKNYDPGDYIGASGLEQKYENELKGKKGARYVLKDNLGREVESFQEGALDFPATSGKDLITTIDLELQKYGEELMQNKIGSIVAIEPKTGEILAMISSPTYNPNLLTINQERGRAYNQLAKDPLQPFFDRSVMAQYPPGSLFKPIVALIAMEEGLLDINRTVYCNGGYFLDGAKTGCHGHPTCTSVTMAIQHSCNAYFVTIFREIVDTEGGFYKPQEGLDIFNSYLERFGMGHTLGIDFPREKPGNYPSSKYYDDRFEKQQAGQKWNSIWIRSLGIGQGELLTTNLQLANMAAILANRGHYITPHLVKAIRNLDGSNNIPDRADDIRFVGIDKELFEPVVDGMEKVVLAGTARMAYTKEVTICGKTGTAENNQRTGKDHSIFFAFAPREQPKIAIAVYVENGGWGGSYAAPIASLMIEKYVTDTISYPRKWVEKRMLDANLVELP